MLSLPTRECGLKFDCVFDRLERRLVTPYAGVWIEMYAEFLEQFGCRVTPYAGVWIEISSVICILLIAIRNSLRGSVD